MTTYKDAVALAQRLRTVSPAIRGVELFGSVLRNGHGRDADFLILVDDALAKRWWREARDLIRVRWPDALYEHRWIVKKFIPFAYAATVHRRRHKRLQASAALLGIRLEALASPTGEIPDFEMFLMPEEWRIGMELNMEVMRQVTDLTNDRNTLGFLKRIAKEAVHVA